MEVDGANESTMRVRTDLMLSGEHGESQSFVFAPPTPSPSDSASTDGETTDPDPNNTPPTCDPATPIVNDTASTYTFKTKPDEGPDTTHPAPDGMVTTDTQIGPTTAYVTSADTHSTSPLNSSTMQSTPGNVDPACRDTDAASHLDVAAKVNPIRDSFHSTPAIDGTHDGTATARTNAIDGVRSIFGVTAPEVDSTPVDARMIVDTNSLTTNTTQIPAAMPDVDTTAIGSTGAKPDHTPTKGLLGPENPPELFSQSSNIDGAHPEPSLSSPPDGSEKWPDEFRDAMEDDDTNITGYADFDGATIEDDSSNTPDEFKHHPYGLRQRKSNINPLQCEDNDPSGTYSEETSTRLPRVQRYKSDAWIRSDDEGDDGDELCGETTSKVSEVSSEDESPKKKQKKKRTRGPRRKKNKQKEKPRASKDDGDSSLEQQPAEPQLGDPMQIDNTPSQTVSRKSEPKKPTDAIPPPSSSLTRTITTKLCHPIQFNAEEADCSTCNQPTYAFLGLGLRKIKIKDTNPGNGIEETISDPGGGGATPTKLCIRCTVTLMRKFCCRKHRLQPISDPAVQTTQFRDAFQRLVEGRALHSDLWCSVCPAPALYRCFGSALRSGSEGCGLLLCEQCAVDVYRDHDGDLEAFLRGCGDGAACDKRPLGLRADAEVLRAEGPLRAFMMRMAAGG